MATERATFAPFAVTIDEVFLLPDRRLVLDRFDDLATTAEGLIAVWRPEGDHHCQVANRQFAPGMGDIAFGYRSKDGDRYGRCAREDAERERVEHVVMHRDAGSPMAGGTDATDEEIDPAECVVANEVERSFGVEVTVVDVDDMTGDAIVEVHLQPPLTGGRIAIRPSAGSGLRVCSKSDSVAIAEDLSSPDV